jgi:hypothetical protein
MKIKPKRIFAGFLVAGLAAAVLWLRPDLGIDSRSMTGESKKIQPVDLSAYADGSPNRQLNLLFIHHSCGGQLLASAGPDQGTNCIYTTHPNGGGLRSRLEQSSYRFHEASYGSRIGEKTDVFDWLPKFRNAMDEILTCDFQDSRYSDGRRNDVVVFKSCFPNNAFKSRGEAPGNSMGPELTLSNAKAAYSALLEEFRKQPQTLFVCLTAPPLAKPPPQPLWRQALNKIRGRIPAEIAGAPLAREFSNWLEDGNGWLKNSNLTNVVVFNYYDVLTGHGQSDLSVYPSGDGYDSHPSREGNEKAAQAFVPFLNRAARRAGLSS